MSKSSDPGPARSGPQVSIIIPTFNRNHFIERSIRSVLDQTYRNLECLVMDGGSSDGSVQTLERLAAEDPRLRYVSEPDEGEVFATNKGFDLVKGDIVGVIASDDFYEKDAVETAVSFLLEHPEFIGVGGDALYVDEQGRSLRRGVITYRGEMSARTLRRILVLRHKSTFVCHGAFFGWQKRLRKHGKLDPAFSVMPDLEFYSRLLFNGERIGCLPRIQFNFSVHPGMGALKYVSKVEAQRRLLHKRYHMRWYHEALWFTIGKFTNYALNPYRSPLLQGLVWEFQMLRARLSEKYRKRAS